MQLADILTADRAQARAKTPDNNVVELSLHINPFDKTAFYLWSVLQGQEHDTEEYPRLSWTIEDALDDMDSRIGADPYTLEWMPETVKA